MAREIRKHYMGIKKFGEESTAEFVEVSEGRTCRTIEEGIRVMMVNCLCYFFLSIPSFPFFSS